MVKRWAHVVDGVVNNISLWDGKRTTWEPPAGVLMIELPEDSPVSVGWVYVENKLMAPRDTG